MIVVSDTSPLNYLILIECVHLLPALFDEIAVPPAVRAELLSADAPPEVRQWALSPPEWLVTPPLTPLAYRPLPRLHPGEQEALQLAQQLKADLILLDEKAARQVARDLGLTVAGTLAILDEGAARGLIDLPEAIDRLRRTNFRVAPYLLRKLLDRNLR